MQPSHLLRLSLVLSALMAWVPASAQTPAARPPVDTGKAVADLPADYVIGVEDVLGVVFWREPEMSGDVTVRPDGKITLALLGDIDAAGLKPAALRDAIQQAADRYLTDANVNVVVRQVNSRKVFITGQVGQAGAYSLTSPRTVLQLIALAGGLTEFARGDNITIMRADNGRTKVFKFDYKKVSKGEAIEQNIQLLPGDTVVVP